MEIPVLVLLLGWPGLIQAEPRLTFGTGPPVRQRAKRMITWFIVGARVGPGVRCVRARTLQSCPTLCNPMDCSPPGSSVHGFLQARILEWVAMPSCRGSSQPRDWTHVSYISCTGRWVLYHHLGCPWCKVGDCRMLKIWLIKSGRRSWRRQMLLQMWHPSIWKLWRQQWTRRQLSCLINAKLYWWQQRDNEGLRAINKQLMAKCESQRVSLASKEALTSSRMLEAKVEQAKKQIKKI